MQNNDRTIESPSPTKPRFFYGYIVAGASFLILMAAYGGRSSYGVFFKPMASELHFNSATTALAFSISMLLEGAFSLIMGGLADRFGPRKVLTVAGIIIGLGYFLMPLAQNVWTLCLFYGIIIGVGMGGVFVPLVSMVTRWFTARRNLVSGIVSGGVGVGTFALPPLLTFFIDKLNWRATFVILGAIITVVVIVAAQFLKRDPSEIGEVPYGESREGPAGRKKPAEGFSFREALRTPQFWIVLTLLSASGFYNMGMSVHIVPDAINLGMTPAAAANILAVTGISMLAGRVILGGLADKTGNRKIFIFAFIFALAALVWMIFSREHWAFYIFAVIIGFTQGGIGVSQSPVTASLFGLKSLGLILGCIGFGSTIGMAVGPYLMGYIFDVTGSYQLAFVAGSILCLVALACAFIIRPHKNVKLFSKL